MSKVQILQVPIEKLHTSLQVREKFDEAKLDELAASMKEVGQQQPIRCRKEGDKLIVVFGERRLRALKRAGFTTASVIVTDQEPSEAEVLELQLVENLQREGLAPMEMARGIMRYMETTGRSAGEAAMRLGFSASTITRSLGLLKLPENVQQQVEAGEITPSAAYELSRIDDPAERERLAGKLATGQLTRDGIVGARKASRQPKAKDAPATLARVTAQLDGGRSVTVAAPGLDLEGLITVLEELLAKARRARPQGLALPTLVKILRDQNRKAGGV